MQDITPVRIATVEEAISKASGISVDDMRGHFRDRAYVEARQAVWLIVHDHLQYSYLKIAKLYGRDHTTIISGVKRMRASKASEKIIDGIKKVCPEVLERRAPGEAKNVEDWRF